LIELRLLRTNDALALESFDVGPSSERWLNEVREIVAGLPGWAHETDSVELDRQVLILTDDDMIVGVAAHEAIRTPSGYVHKDHRYLMVTAITTTRQRTGLAGLLTTSFFEQAAAKERRPSPGSFTRTTTRQSRSADAPTPKPTRHTHPKTGLTPPSRSASEDLGALLQAARIDAVIHRC
jgi:hypothetical protein